MDAEGAVANAVMVPFARLAVELRDSDGSRAPLCLAPGDRKEEVDRELWEERLIVTVVLPRTCRRVTKDAPAAHSASTHPFRSTSVGASTRCRRERTSARLSDRDSTKRQLPTGSTAMAGTIIVPRTDPSQE